MSYKNRLWRTVLGFALAALIASSGAQAQGWQVLPWPARKPVPALIATDLNGQLWRLSDLRGKAVLINFWASWCEPCRAEMPSLQALAQAHGPDQVIVLTVNFKEPAGTVQRFAQQMSLSLPLMLDPQGAMARQWGIKIFPSTVMITADGRVQGVLRGELDWTSAQATQLLAPLLPPAHRAPRQPR